MGSKKSEGIKKETSAPKRNNQYPDSGRFADNLLNLPDTGLFMLHFIVAIQHFIFLFAELMKGKELYPLN